MNRYTIAAWLLSLPVLYILMTAMMGAEYTDTQLGATFTYAIFPICAWFIALHMSEKKYPRR